MKTYPGGDTVIEIKQTFYRKNEEIIKAGDTICVTQDEAKNLESQNVAVIVKKVKVISPQTKASPAVNNGGGGVDLSTVKAGVVVEKPHTAAKPNRKVGKNKKRK